MKVTRKNQRHFHLLTGLVLGAALGAILHPWATVPWVNGINRMLLYPIGQIFLRIIFMTVVPLVFSALVLGIYELGRGRDMGRVAVRTLFFTVVASSISVVIGIGLVNLLKPGVGFQIEAGTQMVESSSVLSIQEDAHEAKGVVDMLIELVPKNPIQTAARALEGDMIPLMVFSLLFGLAMTWVARGRKEEMRLAVILDEVFAISMKIIDIALMLAPVGVFAIIFNTVFKMGPAVLLSLLYYVMVVVTGLLIQQFAVYSFLLRSFGHRSPMTFFRQCWDVYLFAFSTASSNATLPIALEAAEGKLGISRKVSRFVLTVGSTANQNGTALFEGVTVLFLAQVYGVDLTFFQQVQVVVMAVIAGIGTAGVPGGSLPLVMLVLQSVGIPPEGIALILGVDRFLDMCRTTLNVSGDLVMAALVDKEHPDSVIG